MTHDRSFDFFTAGALPAPVLGEADAAVLARKTFGLEVAAHSLGSQQDAYFLLTTGGGEPVGVLKVSNGAFGRVDIDAQDAAADHLARRLPGLRVATVAGSGAR